MKRKQKTQLTPMAPVKTKTLSVTQWRCAVELLADCLKRTQTKVAQVMNDPTNEQFHLPAVNQFAENADTVKLVMERIGDQGKLDLGL